MICLTHHYTHEIRSYSLNLLKPSTVHTHTEPKGSTSANARTSHVPLATEGAVATSTVCAWPRQNLGEVTRNGDVVVIFMVISVDTSCDLW